MGFKRCEEVYFTSNIKKLERAEFDLQAGGFSFAETFWSFVQ